MKRSGAYFGPNMAFFFIFGTLNVRVRAGWAPLGIRHWVLVQ